MRFHKSGEDYLEAVLILEKKKWECSFFGCGGADERDKAQRHQCDPGTAEQDACRIEHDISRETFEKLKACWETIAKGERKP